MLRCVGLLLIALDVSDEKYWKMKADTIGRRK